MKKTRKKVTINSNFTSFSRTTPLPPNGQKSIIGFLGYEYTSCNTFKFYLSMSLTVQVLLIYVLIYPSINYRCLIHPSFTYQCPYLLLLFLLTMSLSMFILLIHALIHSSFTYPCLYLFKFYLFMSLSIQILLIHVSIYPSFTYS